jgi:hypothetical protein
MIVTRRRVPLANAKLLVAGLQVRNRVGLGYATLAQSRHTRSACSNTTATAFSCLSGG